MGDILNMVLVEDEFEVCHEGQHLLLLTGRAACAAGLLAQNSASYF